MPPAQSQNRKLRDSHRSRPRNLLAEAGENLLALRRTFLCVFVFVLALSLSLPLSLSISFFLDPAIFMRSLSHPGMEELTEVSGLSEGCGASLDPASGPERASSASLCRGIRRSFMP